MASGQTNPRYLSLFTCLFPPLLGAKEEWEQKAVSTAVDEKTGYQPSPSLFLFAFCKGNIFFPSLFHSFINNKQTRIVAIGFYWMIVWGALGWGATFVIFLHFKAPALQGSVFRHLVFKPYLLNATSTCPLVGVTEVFLFCVQCKGSQLSRAAFARLENSMFCPKFPWKCLRGSPALYLHTTKKHWKSCALFLFATICLDFLSNTSCSNFRKKKDSSIWEYRW